MLIVTTGKLYVMCFAIWYHLYNLKNVKNTLGGVLLLVNLSNFTESNTPPWVFFTFFKLYRWYQTAQSIIYANVCIWTHNHYHFQGLIMSDFEKFMLPT